MPEAAKLGSKARFRGEFVVEQSATDFSCMEGKGELAGRLFDVDLTTLVAEPCPHKISGTAEVVLGNPALFAAGRLESLSARIKAGPGKADRSLLQDCVEKLGLETGVDLGIAEEKIKYQQLAFDVTLNAAGLEIDGRCPFNRDGVDYPGVIMADGRLCMLANSAKQAAPQPVAALIRALTPPGALQAPATRQADWLVRHLPLPK